MFRFKFFLAAALAVGTAGLTYTASEVATATETESGYDEGYSVEAGDGDKEGKGDKGKGGFGNGKFGKGDKGKFGKGKGEKGKGEKGKGEKGKGEKKGPPKGDQ
jgi:hypothetical protein